MYGRGAWTIEELSKTIVTILELLNLVLVLVKESLTIVTTVEL